MKKEVAIYPGSFNPWHDGHQDVAQKALRVFNKLILAVGQNPDKPDSHTDEIVARLKGQQAYGIKNGCIEVVQFKGLLADYVSKVNENVRHINAVIRGLRNEQDFCFEQIQQYHNEDLKIGIPTFYVISSRSLVHLSSSAVRMIEKARSQT